MSMRYYQKNLFELLFEDASVARALRYPTQDLGEEDERLAYEAIDTAYKTDSYAVLGEEIVADMIGADTNTTGRKPTEFFDAVDLKENTFVSVKTSTKSPNPLSGSPVKLNNRVISAIEKLIDVEGSKFSLATVYIKKKDDESYDVIVQTYGSVSFNKLKGGELPLNIYKDKASELFGSGKSYKAEFKKPPGFEARDTRLSKKDFIAQSYVRDLYKSIIAGDTESADDIYRKLKGEMQ